MKVTFKNITKKFDDVTAVSNFSSEIADGQLVCLLGPSGCGKSTLLNMMCGIHSVTEGQIFFDDRDVTNLPIDLRNVGMVFQNYALYPHMTVLENICFPLEMQKMPKKQRLEKAETIARLVHVDNLLKRYPKELSGGQQQRVAIARALVKSPSLLLMDEPLSNLDARLRIEMREEIRRIQTETKVTTIFVTHDQEEALSISDKVFLMKGGCLVQEGIGQELYRQPKNRFVAEFLGTPPINQIDCNENEETCRNLLNVSSFSKGLPAENLRDFVLEVRAESFCFKPCTGEEAGNAPQAVISQVYEMGKEKIASVKIGNIQARAVLTGDEDFAIGQELMVSLKKTGVFLFNRQNGERAL